MSTQVMGSIPVNTQTLLLRGCIMHKMSFCQFTSDLITLFRCYKTGELLSKPSEVFDRGTLHSFVLNSNSMLYVFVR